jgi:alpha-ketoglutarate-dependent taurine dioxygenase
VSDQSDFADFLTAIKLPRMEYTEGATPRTKLGDSIYTSTEYPPDQTIALHNELNYVITWPMKILFFCVIPAERGGETPIADVRKVFQRIDPAIRQRFIDKGWMLMRNAGEGLSLPWQTTFHASTREELEEYCRRAQVEFEWKDHDRLRTRQVRPAVARHPKTREWLWFNHVAFWHVSSLTPEVREAMFKVFREEDLPYNTYYGDGSPIEDEVVAALRAAYDAETVHFPWQRGDLLLLDNMLVAHGRSTFSGARKILTAMGAPNSDRGLH